MKKYLYIPLLIFLISCESSPYEGNVIYDIVSGKDETVDMVLSDLDKYRVQILYTQVDRDSMNTPSFTTYSLGVNNKYFYPASTVKFPTSVLALQKLGELNIENLDRSTTMLTDSAYSGQSAVTYDSTSENALPSIGHYIKKILIVSDNDAYNRLYEFLGQEYINDELFKKGFTNSRITHRLSIFLSQDENRHTNPVSFYNGDSLVYEKDLEYSENDYTSDTAIMMGVGHINGEEYINEPMDFQDKNYTSIPDMQNVLKSVIFPESVDPSKRFNLTEDDYQFLYKYMSMLPAESKYPDYSEYYDSYVKFFMFGDNEDPMPKNIRIFNKVGDAYGFLIDNAYIVDLENNVEFFLTATLQVNDNQVYNDGNYEYDEIGFPFLSRIGTYIYNYELERERANIPNLEKFRNLEY